MAFCFAPLQHDVRADVRRFWRRCRAVHGHAHRHAALGRLVHPAQQPWPTVRWRCTGWSMKPGRKPTPPSCATPSRICCATAPQARLAMGYRQVLLVGATRPCATRVPVPCWALHLAEPGHELDALRLAEGLRRDGVAVLKIVHSHLQALMQALALAGRDPAEVLPTHTLVLGAKPRRGRGCARCAPACASSTTTARPRPRWACSRRTPPRPTRAPPPCHWADRWPASPRTCWTRTSPPSRQAARASST